MKHEAQEFITMTKGFLAKYAHDAVHKVRNLEKITHSSQA